MNVNIYQRFNLDERELIKLIDEDEGFNNSPESYLKQTLVEMGYEVLTSNESFAGVPKSVILGANLEKDVKGDFYKVANLLRFPFVSGEFYTPARLI